MPTCFEIISIPALLICSNFLSIPEHVQHFLVADILEKRHLPDKGLDKQIDLDTQYVRLKLLVNKTMAAMQRDKLERPDRYQHSLQKQEGSEIQDEDLIKDSQKYILIRGRAGIGKSTLVQRLLWKWANGEWATKFVAIFMLNLRYLMIHNKPTDLSRLLSLYAVYKPKKLDAKWLKKNEGRIGIVLGKITISLLYLGLFIFI